MYQFFEAEGCTLNDVLLKGTQFRSKCHYGPLQYQEGMLSLRHCLRDFTSGLVVKNLPCSAEDGGSILGWEIKVFVAKTKTKQNKKASRFTSVARMLTAYLFIHIVTVIYIYIYIYISICVCICMTHTHIYMSPPHMAL